MSSEPIDPNYEKAIALTKDIRDFYGEDELYNNPSILSRYYADLVEMQQTGQINRDETAFLISDTAWFKAVSYFQKIEQVVNLADYYSLASTRFDDREHKRWERLTKTIWYTVRFYSRD